MSVFEAVKERVAEVLDKGEAENLIVAQVKGRVANAITALEADFEHALGDLGGDAEELRLELQKKLEATEIVVNEAEKKIAALEADAAKAEAKIAELAPLAGQVPGLQEKIAEGEKLVKEAEDKVSELESHAAALEAKVAELTPTEPVAELPATEAPAEPVAGDGAKAAVSKPAAKKP